jgi:hypothetical protein
MLVTPLPGTSREHLQKTLRELHEALVILQNSGASSAEGRFAEYLEWAALAVRRLGRQISAADLDRLVLTPGYARLLSYVGTQRALNVLVSVEIEQRVSAFAEGRMALDEQVARWAPLCAFVIADTSVYIEHEKKLKELDLAALVDAEGDLAPIHLLVPIVVLDELDGLKNKGPTQHVKWRAGYTLAVFDQVFSKGTGARPNSSWNSAMKRR